ncbi:hypothetical protein G6F35_017255 [Rhizopus arrhizus]|nr:hypothetical protein G6F35_017255 [Rhizopus arrhizus]
MGGQARPQQGQREQRHQHQRDPAADLVGLRHPLAAHRRQAGHHGEGERHAQQQRQRAAHEGTVGAREHERQHRQDAGAEQGQRTPEVGKQQQQHGQAPDVGEEPTGTRQPSAVPPSAAPGTNISAAPFMQ